MIPERNELRDVMVMPYAILFEFTAMLMDPDAGMARIEKKKILRQI